MTISAVHPSPSRGRQDRSTPQTSGFERVISTVGRGVKSTPFSLELNEDQLRIQQWVHDFAAGVIRPAAQDWDEREETPWPIIEEAARVGLYSLDFVGHAFTDPSGVLLPVVMEEVGWGDAGIGLAIFGTSLAVAGIMANGTPEQVDEWLPLCFEGDGGKINLAAFGVSEPDAAPMSARYAAGPSTTRPVTSGSSTAPRRSSPTAASPTSTCWSSRSIRRLAHAATPASSCPHTHQG